MDSTQRVQEDQYDFPYHHLVSVAPFSLSKHLWWGYAYAAYLEEVIRLLQSYTSNMRSIVDIGCGDGRFVAELARTFPSKRIVGVDYSERSLQFARAFVPTAEFHSNLDGTFDAFTLIEVLEHIKPEELDGFLIKVAKHLTPDGIGIITVPHSNVPINQKHYQHFDERSLRNVVEKYFYIEKQEYMNARNIWEFLIKRLFANSFFILNNPFLLNRLFMLYKKKCLRATADNATRLLCIVRKLH